MPCERKHVEAINSEASNWPSCGRACDGECESCYNWSKLTKAIDAALAACDESPCVDPEDDVHVDGVCTACGCTQYGTINCMEPCDCGGRELVVSFPPLPAAPEVHNA